MSATSERQEEPVLELQHYETHNVTPLSRKSAATRKKNLVGLFLYKIICLPSQNTAYKFSDISIFLLRFK